MNAIVEVTTAEVVVEAKNVTVSTVIEMLEVSIPVVVTSTLRVPSIGGTSISAVSPDNYFMEGTALAAA